MLAARQCFLILCALCVARAAPLPGTEPLDATGDLALQMVESIKKYLLRATIESKKTRKPTVERLKYILGLVDQRIPFDKPETFAPLGASPLLAKTATYSIHAVRWPVLEGIHAEGILIEPAHTSRGLVVAVPDADQAPERFAAAQQLAAAGFTVLAPALVDRRDRHSGNPGIRMTNQPHREWLYRMTYPLGRHILGLEIQKVLAAVDWFERRSSGKPIGVWGYGEGGALALYSAAVDPRIRVAGVSGYFGPREDLWKQPIYRNVWGLLKDFGDAEVASLITPRKLIVDLAPGPIVNGPQPPVPQRAGAAPGELKPLDRASIEVELRGKAEPDGLPAFISALGGTTPKAFRAVDLPAPDPDRRQSSFISEIREYGLRLIDRSERERTRAWKPENAAAVRDRMRNDLIGELPRDTAPLHPRTREILAGQNWKGYEVVLDAAPGVPAYGILLLPSDLRPGQKRAVVVMQHGLDGRPQDLFNQASNRAFDVYQNVGQKLIDAGFVVYLPQNPYIHDFRPINRLANPLGLTLFSFILRQHEKTLSWLQSLPFVDPARIGFYGLSYGGTTALRVPPLIDTYALSICSGNFNEWIRKLTTTTEPYSYMFTREYEILEFNLAGIAGHAEMAMLMAPRPFMVERGHADGVGIDEWVGYEYAKVQRFYERQQLGDRASIAFFEGPHRIDGPATIAFLTKFLKPFTR